MPERVFCRHRDSKRHPATIGVHSTTGDAETNWEGEAMLNEQRSCIQRFSQNEGCGRDGERRGACGDITGAN